MLKKICLILFFSLPTLAFSENFKCKGIYDIYDDTCYFKSGAFIFFGFKNGSREVVNNSKFRYFFWFNGSPYVYHRYRYWHLW